MSRNNPTLKSLRSAVSSCQRAILDDIWAHIKEKNIGLPERPLLEKYGKATLAEEISRLGGTVIYTHHEDNKLRYNLGIVGIFLTSDGTRLEKLIERYLIVLRDAYNRNREIERFSSNELANWAPDITPSELNELRHILDRWRGLFPSSLAGSNAEEWFVSVDNEVVELKNVDDWPSYIERRIMRGYDPRLPYSERERMIRHAQKYNALLRPSKQTRVPGQTAELAEPIDFSCVNDEKIRDILDSDWLESQRVYEVSAWKSCVILCGGIIEALLTDSLSRIDANRIASAKAQLSMSGTLRDWSLVSMIAVAEHIGLLTKGSFHLSNAIREFRNLIHPVKQARENVEIDQQQADIARSVVKCVVHDLKKRKAGNKLD